MKAWFKKWWWLVVLFFISVVALVLFLIFRKHNSSEAIESYIAKTKAEILKAQTDLEIERLKIATQAEKKQLELSFIQSEKDDEKRRMMLADYLDRLL